MHSDTDEARLTAYVLGELDAPETAALEAELLLSDAARREVEDIRRITVSLREALASSAAGPALTDSQRERIESEAARVSAPSAPRPHSPVPERVNPARVRSWIGLAGFATAAAALTAVIIPSLLRARASRPPADYIRAIVAEDPAYRQTPG